MKKVMLLAVLLGGVSFSSMASNAPNKKGEPSSQAIVQKTTVRSANELKKSKPTDCGWQRYEIGCGGAYDYLGNAYCCNYGDLLFAKMTTFEQYCN